MVICCYRHLEGDGILIYQREHLFRGESEPGGIISNAVSGTPDNSPVPGRFSAMDRLRARMGLKMLDGERVQISGVTLSAGVL